MPFFLGNPLSRHIRDEARVQTFEFELDYDQLERLGNDEMGEIQKKLGKVASLSLNAGVANQQHLLQFLNNKNPFGLRIEVSKFSSTFFENLVKCCN